MASYKFELVVYGGKADEAEAKVAADKVGDVLKGMTLDVQEICQNLSGGGDVSPEECRIYVVGAPSKGKSIAFPMSTGESAEDWGMVGMRAYVSGVRELRESDDLGNPKTPKGFGPSILRRIRASCQAIGDDHEGFAVDLPAVNGTPALRATFDARLKTAVELKLAAIEHARAQSSEAHEAPDLKLYGYSLQGVLFEMSDPHYESPEGIISVEIDARDGKQWLCHLDKKIAPANLQDLWRTEVLVTGEATFRPRKPLLEATSFQPLPGISDPVKAMEELISVLNKPSGETVQAFMDRVRERD